MLPTPHSISQTLTHTLITEFSCHIDVTTIKATTVIKAQNTQPQEQCDLDSRFHHTMDHFICGSVVENSVMQFYLDTFCI